MSSSAVDCHCCVTNFADASGEKKKKKKKKKHKEDDWEKGQMNKIVESGQDLYIVAQYERYIAFPKAWVSPVYFNFL